MKLSYNSPVLLVAGLALSVAFIGVIIHGQVKKNVRVPHDVEWSDSPVRVCPDDGVVGGSLQEMSNLLKQHSLPVTVASTSCDGSPAIHVRVSPADVDRIFPPEATIDGVSAGGAFERTVEQGFVVDCTVYLLRGNDTLSLVHEGLHCLGYDHAVNPPSGHVMNKSYSRIGLDDWRGIP